MRVAVLIDGSNLLGALGRADLGYPALAPLLESIRDGDQLITARFYGAPPPHPIWRARFQQFLDANRHLDMDFFLGYRSKRTGEEKAIDVALAIDPLDGAHRQEFDRAAVVGGDGDHTYAFHVTKRVAPVRVHLIPGQPRSGLSAARIAYRLWTADELVAAGICDRGASVPVPRAHSAPAGSPQVARLLEGALGTPAS